MYSKPQTEKKNTLPQTVDIQGGQPIKGFDHHPPNFLTNQERNLDNIIPLSVILYNPIMNKALNMSSVKLLVIIL